MYRWLNDHSSQQSNHPGNGSQRGYDEFQGRIIVVDLATIDGQTEEFEGRAWLEHRCREKLPVGWDLEWQPDRVKDSDNPIALMQFADETTALLLRTHRTSNWLPMTVMKALLSEACAKVGVGWDGPDKQKMQSTFNFQPVGIVDLSEIAKKKAVAEQGLKSLSEHFGYKMRKDSRIARSNWAQYELTQEQIQYAAEDAYFSYLLYDKLRALPDPPVKDQEGMSVVNQGVLEMREGWTEQGIVRKHDGLYCMMCDKGPMTVPQVMIRHIEGQKHRKRLEMKSGLLNADGTREELSDEYTMQGIICGDGLADHLKVGEYKCTICDAGPFTSWETVKAHLQSKRHSKNTAPAPEPAEVPAEAKDPFADALWNMPDYVSVEGNVIRCTLCDSKANAVAPMRMHLGGEKHARKCRGLKHDEIMYIKERDRLEVMNSGQPVVRAGCKVPKRSDKAGPAKADTQAAPADAPKEEAPASRPLPAGWQEFTDTRTGDKYYWNPATETSQWERPEAPRAPPRTLPPGWREVWCAETRTHYFADVETQAAQWEPPPQYVHGDWSRQVDPAGRAFWASSQSEAFYEDDQAWQRLVDQDRSIYWSNSSSGVRFFEKAPA